MNTETLPICDLFTSIQGEGKFAGIPSIFIRVSGCNLKCIFKDSICDTPYSSFLPEKGTFTLEDVKNIINKNPKINHIVITGGEPLLYRAALEKMLSEIWDNRFVITIETNGTLPPLNPLNGKFKIALYSISPKLHTSVGKLGTKLNINGKEVEVTQEMIDKQESKRINITNLYSIILACNDYQLKFVYSGPECIKEIENIHSRLSAMADADGAYIYQYFRSKHPSKHTMLMPEGITEEQLTNSRKEICDICVEKGWAYTDRLHIIIWGDKRGV